MTGYYWMHLIARYENLRFLGTWGRALHKQPNITLPKADNEAIFSMTPLRYPEQALELLKHIQEVTPENDDLNKLIDMFCLVCESKQENI